jgi:hypothetical protein
LSSFGRRVKVPDLCDDLDGSTFSFPPFSTGMILSLTIALRTIAAEPPAERVDTPSHHPVFLACDPLVGTRRSEGVLSQRRGAGQSCGSRYRGSEGREELERFIPLISLELFVLSVNPSALVQWVEARRTIYESILFLFFDDIFPLPSPSPSSRLSSAS